MINEKKYVYVKVKISKKEYELFKAIVNQHNNKNIRHDVFRDFDKISLSKLGLLGFRQVSKMMLSDSSRWSYYGKN